MELLSLTSAERNNDLINDLTELWEQSVLATHAFLSKSEIEKIKSYVPNAIRSVECLIIVRAKSEQIVGFIGYQSRRIEMLFIAPDMRSHGLGKALLNYAIKNGNVNEVTVNEQNPQAKGFYEHLGFKVYKRTDNDEEGNPYPLLYMRLSR